MENRLIIYMCDVVNIEKYGDPSFYNVKNEDAPTGTSSNHIGIEKQFILYPRDGDALHVLLFRHAQDVRDEDGEDAQHSLRVWEGAHGVTA